MNDKETRMTGKSHSGLTSQGHGASQGTMEYSLQMPNYQSRITYPNKIIFQEQEQNKNIFR